MFARGVAIEPQSVRFHANLGEALRTIRRFDEALVHLRKAVTLAPTDVPAWNSLGLVAFAIWADMPPPSMPIAWPSG